MQETLEEIVRLQREYNSQPTPAMRRRGELVRNLFPNEIRRHSAALRAAMGRFGDDADVQGKDNMGQNARIPWVRWYSKGRSPSATHGWYVVYLFHPDASGVSLCLSHGSTSLEGSAFVQKSDAEVAELMAWAAAVVGREFDADSDVKRGVSVGKSFDLARAYERTTIFSKFYSSGGVPSDGELERDLTAFVRVLAKLYQAQELGLAPGAPSPDLLALREAVETISSPLKRRAGGQGRGLSGPARKVVELHAMQAAKRWLKDEGFEFTDVSATDSCDFRAKRGGDEWVIEVKGTTGGPSSVLLTANEVDLHRASYPKNILLVVHGISLSEDGIRPSGGELIALSPWLLDEEKLKAVCYEYRL